MLIKGEGDEKIVDLLNYFDFFLNYPENITKNRASAEEIELWDLITPNYPLIIP